MSGVLSDFVRRILHAAGKRDDSSAAPRPAEMRVAGASPAERARWERVQRVFTSALDLPEQLRADHVARACADAPDVRAEVLSLLAAHERPGLVDRPVTSLLDVPSEWTGAAHPLSATEPPAPAPGQVVGRYRVGARIAMGGSGVVCRAVDLRLERTVALKFLRPHLSADAEAAFRFVAEAQIVAALDHPNICTVLEIGETDSGQLFIAMPLCGGGGVDARIAAGRLDVHEAVDIVTQAARGLAKAHEQGIIHRDVKAANLVLTAEHVVKVVDFGIAKLAGAQTTSPGWARGTVAYMSPEQVRGDPMDARTDVWSLGVVLYELLAGTRPFAGTADALPHRILHEQPPPLHDLRADVPRALADLVGDMLAKSPAGRIASMGEVLSRLERLDERDWAAGVLPEGERRHATVVVTAVEPYAELVERLRPEESEGVIERIAAAGAACASRHGGTVHACTGDQIVLLFGAPSAHEDDARQAARAAMALHADIAAVGQELAPRLGSALRARTGIATGTLIIHRASPAGAARIAGEPMRIAAALAERAPVDDIWASPECARLIEPFVRTETLPALRLHGDAPRITPRRLLGETDVRSRLEAAAKSGLTQFTGRERELEILRAALHRATRGEGQLVTLVGEAGLGKSRMLLEFRRLIDAEQVAILYGRCESYGTTSAYLPFIEVLRTALHPLPAATPEAVAARVAAMGAELEEFVPLFLHLLALTGETQEIASHLQGEPFRVAMRDALAAVVTASAQRRPTVLLLEDWHWVDDASHAVLARVAELTPGHALLVVVTSRPERRTSWHGLSAQTAITLPPLLPAASRDILRSVLRAHDVPQALVDALHERSGGNPFFLEEMAQTLMEEGALSVHDGTVRLAGAVEALDLPETVQGVIRARLDRLDRHAREVACVAAVIGRSFSRVLLERACSDAHRLDAALATLQASGVIQQTAIVPSPSYRFKHVLTQEVAYATLLEHQRAELHGRVGSAIEELDSARLDEQFERLAHHHSRAGNWSKAVTYGIRSADRASALSQFTEALHLLERTQRWAASLPGDEQERVLTRILLRQERLCETLGLRERQQHLIDELITLLQPSGDGASLAEVYLRQGDVSTLLRRFDDAERALTRSLDLRRACGDVEGERNTLRSLGLMRWHQGRNEEALTYMRRTLAIDRERGDLDGIAGDLANLGIILKGLGMLDEARDALEEALDLSARNDASGLPNRGDLLLKRSYILHNLANVHRARGDTAAALEALAQATVLTREKRLPIQLSFHLTTAAHIRLQLGEVEDALRLYEQAVALTRDAGFTPGLSQSLRILGDVLLGLGRADDALPCLREAAMLFAQLQDVEAEGELWGKVAHVHEQRGRHADALAAWTRARALRRRSGDRAGELHAAEGVARATRHTVSDHALVDGAIREALSLAVAVGDRAAEGRLRNTLGILAWQRGAYTDALAEYERALAPLTAVGDESACVVILNSIGVTLRAGGRQGEALRRLEEARERAARVGQPLLEGHALAALGDVHADLGRPDQAERCYERSLEKRLAIGDERGAGWMLYQMARARAARGDASRARALAAQAAVRAAACGDEELTRSLSEIAGGDASPLVTS
ncbi:MAG TPA: tetratricopeptide repeat protein [Gemmatimonadaceae bacterium]|nr:tetratricopeptide repeat protein [Gemmatimonadaceae bacterium]